MLDPTQYNNLVAILSGDDSISPEPSETTTSWIENLLLPAPDRGAETKSTSLWLYILAYIPTLIATISASVATGAPPTYFNTRHVVILPGVFGSWVVSHAIGVVVGRTLQGKALPGCFTSLCQHKHGLARS